MAKNEKKRGLGRGLSALMADVTSEGINHSAALQAPGSGIVTLPIESIFPNPDQPRKNFKQADLDDLSASIAEKGVIQPLVVRQIDGNSYQIVAGERRWRAAQQAQLHELPVVIQEFSDLEVLEIAIIENIQRADLSVVEEASGYRQLMDAFGHTQDQLAKSLGKSRSHIANLLRLLNLPKKVLEYLESGDLSAGHARALVPSSNAEALAAEIMAKGLSVRATEALVKRDATGPEKNVFLEGQKRAAPEKDADTRALEGDLSATLAMKVSIEHAPGGENGKISISYKSLEQLDELCQRLGGH